jgi:hypothetical protein
MSSLKKLLHKALSSHLMDKLQFSDIPACQWVDKDFGQAELMQKGELSFPLPAVLIAFPTARFEPMVSKDQTGDMQIRLKIMFENYLDSSEGNINQDIALQFFDFNERVNNAIDTFTFQGVQGITRIGEDEDDNHGNVIVSTITFQAVLFESGTDNNQEVTGPTFSVAKTDASNNTYDTGWKLPT